MKLLNGVVSLVSSQADHIKVYLYSLLGLSGASAVGVSPLSVSTTALVSLAPAVVSLAHEALGDLGVLVREAKADVAAAESQDAAASK